MQTPRAGRDTPQLSHTLLPHREYLARVAFLRKRQFTCKFSGRSGLTYEEAAISEARFREEHPKARHSPKSVPLTAPFSRGRGDVGVVRLRRALYAPFA